MIAIKYLEYLGLSEKEAKVYTALLRTHALSGMDICRETGLKKPTVYVLLETLRDKKLIREIHVGKRLHFAAESPEVFRDAVEKKRIEIETQAKKINDIIFELKSMERKEGERPVVRFYEGKEAVKDAIREFVCQAGYSPGDDYGVYAYDSAEGFFGKKDLDEIDRRRLENNIKFKAVYSGDHKFIEAGEGRSLIKVAQDRFPLLSDISIFGDEVMIDILGKNAYGISVKNKEFATTMKSLIEYIFSCQPKH